eukprot:1860907-Ditylum_brightwellii.AAC.1
MSRTSHALFIAYHKYCAGNIVSVNQFLAMATIEDPPELVFAWSGEIFDLPADELGVKVRSYHA